MIGHVDTNFRTIVEREGRAITGLSMGGYGAITLGLRHPEMFVTIGSTSGSLETGNLAAARLRGEATPPPRQLTPDEQAALEEFQRLPNSVIGIEDFDSQEERTPKGTRFVTAEEADAYDPFKLIGGLLRGQLPYIYIDCGTEDRLIVGGIRFTGLLIEAGIAFQFMQLPGGHDPDYWSRSLGHIVAAQYEVMQRALGERPTFALP